MELTMTVYAFCPNPLCCLHDISINPYDKSRCISCDTDLRSTIEDYLARLFSRA